MNLLPSHWIEAIEKYLGQTKNWLQLHQRLINIEARVAKLEGGATHLMACAQCGSSNLTRTGTRDSPGPFGQLGLKDGIYHCADCDTDTYIELPAPR